MATIPIIDISPFLDGSDVGGVAAAVDEACCTIGFFVIVGHGVDAQVMDAARSVAADYFALPYARKVAGLVADGRDYSPIGAERLAYTLDEETPADLKEAFSITQPDRTDDPYFTDAEALDLFPPVVFPLHPVTFQSATLACFRVIGSLCDQIMQLFAVALGLDRSYFDAMIDRPFSCLRYVHYPAPTAPPEPGQLRAGAHTDYGTFTLVRADEAPGGLQVMSRDEGWIDVPAVADSFVCNIGDLMAMWTNDRWVSTLHRVAVPDEADWAGSDRLSIVYFHEPNRDAVAEALPTCVSPVRPAKYAPITAGDHNRMKFSKQASTAEVGR